MKPVFLSALILLSLTVMAQTTPEAEQQQRTDPRLQAPGTLSGYVRPGEARPGPEPTVPPSVLSAPRVLRFHDERRSAASDPFPQLGRTPGMANPWEQGDDGAMPDRGAPPPPPASRGPVNPWSLDEQLLSAPGIPGLDRSLPLAPIDPLLSPMPYAPLPSAPYGGMYPPAGGSPFYPFEGGRMPGFDGDRGRFPFTPMDWF